MLNVEAIYETKILFNFWKILNFDKNIFLIFDKNKLFKLQKNNFWHFRSILRSLELKNYTKKISKISSLNNFLTVVIIGSTAQQLIN